MIIAELGNRVVEINESQIDLYNSKGYLIKQDDVVIRHTSELEECKAKLDEALAEIEKLKEELKVANAKVAKATKTSKAQEKPAEEVAKTTKSK